MKIGIDTSPVEQNPAGVGQYAINLINSLFRIDDKNEYIIYSTKPYKTDKENIVISKNSKYPFAGIFWMKRVSMDAKKRKVDILISPSNMLFALLFPKTIQFIYDLAPIYYSKFFSRKAVIMYKLLTKFVLPRAWKIAVDSNTVKSEIVTYTGINESKITVIYPSINEIILSDASTDIPFKLPEKYILTISTLEPRKNIIKLIEGFNEYLKSSKDNVMKLVIVGKKGWFYTEIFKCVSNLKLKDRVIFAGYVEDKHISHILKNASTFAYLSEYEGFGMPILEALYFGLPTIVNDIPVFNECFKDEATFVNANDAKAITNAFKLSKTNNSFDKTKYSWEKSATILLKLINS